MCVRVDPVRWRKLSNRPGAPPSEPEYNQADMATKEIDLATGRHQQQAQCHLMPCLIEHKQQSVRAREYFWPTIRQLQAGGDNEQGRGERTGRQHQEQANDNQDQDSNNPILTASFRGRPLQGQKLKLPDGFKGYAIGKGPNNKCSKSFDEFTYWNWDELPTKADQVVKALRWVNLAKGIHNPVE